MAKRRYSNRSKKIQPAVQTMTFVVPEGNSYLDLSLAASLANRRQYDQQLNWAVSGFTVLSGATTGQNLSIFKLPETWVCENSLVKSRALWNKMNDQVLDEEPAIEGRFADFKVNFDSDMVSQDIQTQTLPLGKILTPLSEDGNTGVIHTTNSLTNADFVLPGVSPRADWVYSTIQIPNDGAPGNTQEYSLHVVGADTAGANQSRGLIKGYARSRSRPQSQDPNVPLTEGWMTELFDVGDANEEIRDDLTADNDRPPYPVSPEETSGDFYPGGDQEYDGGQLHDICVLSGTQVAGKNKLSGGVFQAGLVKFNLGAGAGGILIQVHLVPGPHRGYLCSKVGA